MLFISVLLVNGQSEEAFILLDFGKGEDGSDVARAGNIEFLHAETANLAGIDRAWLLRSCT